MVKKGRWGFQRLRTGSCNWPAPKILASIFESDFVDTSYGYRPNRSAKEAIEDMKFNLHLGNMVI